MKTMWIALCALLACLLTGCLEVEEDAIPETVVVEDETPDSAHIDVDIHDD